MTHHTGHIRLAVSDDGASLAEIYAPMVRETVVSFETEPPSAQEMSRRVASLAGRFPFLVWEHDQQVRGYAYAGPHRARAAYGWSVDVSVYLAASARGQGLGRRLYTSLLEITRRQGFCNAYAGVTLPNPASVGLHEAMGFRPVGVYERVGYKQGRWCDVGWWQLRLRDDDAPPPPLLSLDALQATPDWDPLLTWGTR